MTASAAKSSFGVTLKRNGTVIAEITKISVTGKTLSTLDVTNHASPDGYDEFIGGRLNGGEWKITGNFISSDAQQIGLQTDLEAKTLQTFVLTWPTDITATCTVTALVTEFTPTGDFSIDGRQEFTATLKISGKPALAISATVNVTALTITTATLYPTFAAATYTYEATSTGASVTVTATFAAGTATASNGTSTVALTSGAASAALALGVAGTVTTITITVTETGKVPTVYTLRIAKTA